MRSGPKLELERPLVLWSLSLATFRGFRQSVYDQSFCSGPISKFWAYAFVLSKAPELGTVTRWSFYCASSGSSSCTGSTISVVLYSWSSYKDQFMHIYYAMRAAGMHVPPLCAVVITTAQILQMAMGLAVSGLAYCWIQDGCPSYLDNIVLVFLMYLTYLLLFSLFFLPVVPQGLRRLNVKR
ncbi:elongation of very long chain fatty acids protein 6-like [Scleropages formosus]|uniref:Elongation of very long chain fatty acids protein n=1 Tax=Scleropages formosus TaxID=113540 RepID=A0A0P7TGT3_SCLFO|nr:elongation of very long chain fatty acids protein 6-like [Scleropages formosus]